MKQITSTPIPNNEIQTILLSGESLVSHIINKPNHLPALMSHLSQDEKDDLFIQFSDMGHLTNVKLLYTSDMTPSIKAKAFNKAVTQGHIDIVTYFINLGMPINTPTKQPICKAVKYKHLTIVQLLLDNDANVFVQSNYALECAIDNKSFEIVKTLVNHICENKPDEIPKLKLSDLVEFAFLHGNIETIQFLVKTCKKHQENLPNIVYFFKNIINRGDYQIVKYSLSIYPNHIITQNSLISAATNGFHNIFKLLFDSAIASGLDLSKRHFELVSDIIYKNNTQITTYLLDYIITNNIKVSKVLLNDYLIETASEGDITATKQLIMLGADPSYDRYEAIKEAMNNNHTNVFDYLQEIIKKQKTTGDL